MRATSVSFIVLEWFGDRLWWRQGCNAECCQTPQSFVVQWAVIRTPNPSGIFEVYVFVLGAPALAGCLPKIGAGHTATAIRQRMSGSVQSASGLESRCKNKSFSAQPIDLRHRRLSSRRFRCRSGCWMTASICNGLTCSWASGHIIPVPLALPHVRFKPPSPRTTLRMRCRLLRSLPCQELRCSSQRTFCTRQRKRRR